MTTVRVSTHSAGVSKHDCGCGCGGTAGRCCGLECLVRPNFYCGQLLSDADLSAVVQWTRDRLSLSRYRDGWGVVCGLEVTCSQPEGAGGCGCQSSSDSKLWINAGYAVDCCGNDLVVCEPIAVDLGSVCRPADDPCADPCFPQVAKAPPKTDGEGEGDFKRAGLNIKRDQQIVVDLYLRYGEQPANGQRPLFRGNCADQQSCEHSRVLERPVPVLVVRSAESVADSDPERDEYEKQLKEGIQKATVRIVELLSDANPDTILRKLGDYRIYGTCFVADYVRAQQQLLNQQPPKIDDTVRARIGAWLLIDWLQHAMICECTTCRTDEGVAIARLWLWRKDGRTECCRPLLVNNAAPYRRGLKRDCRPAPLFRRDLARYYGYEVKQAAAALAREGVRVVLQPVNAEGGKESKPIVSLATANVIFSLDPSDTAVTMLTAQDILDVARVVGFESAGGAQDGKNPASATAATPPANVAPTAPSAGSAP